MPAAACEVPSSVSGPGVGRQDCHTVGPANCSVSGRPWRGAEQVTQCHISPASETEHSELSV